MVGRETKMMPEREVESSTRQNGGAGGGGGENHPFTSLGRQSSIYSLTLDEFQHALCENGKNFGSMNMDEFLVSIWNAEENNNNNHQAVAASHSVPPNHNGFNNNNNGTGGESGVFGGGGGSSGNQRDNKRPGIAKQPSLARQGSLTLPAPLCRKTVDEVWSEIHRGGGSGGGGESNGRSNGQNNAHKGGGETAARQPTFGEMTLEDFLVKAGVVREHPTIPKPILNPTPSNVIPAPTQPQQLYSAFQGTGGGYQQAPPVQPGVCYGGGGGFGGGGQQMAMVGPLSPVSSDGLGHGQVDNIGGGQYGVDMGGLRGRKRLVDGPVEKVVERRQRRMIKNRESAARSRARKQAYTVELEAELNQLKEENAQLKHALGELERKRKQQYFESLKTRAQPKLPKASGRLRTLVRNPSCPL
ncbi:Basic-leucine zipper domain-containing protein [Hirschfeldia incana]|nr:Basic-leucine zipper domain-containing protein [Hirschfeldia incana]